jgi:predicted kinase
MKQMLILRGVPGAGKSTHAQHIAAAGVARVEIMSADHYFIDPDGVYRFAFDKLGEAHKKCFRSVLAHLNQGFADMLVVDNTNISAVEIAPYVALANAFGLQHQILTFNTPPEVAAARCVHGVPENKIKTSASRLQAEERLFPRFWNHTQMFFKDGMWRHE